MNDLRTLAREAINERGSVGALVVRHLGNYTADTSGAMQLRLTEGSDASVGGFEGCLVVMDVEDSYGTTFRPGCFEAGGLDEAPYAYLWMHDPWEPTGWFTAAERTDGDVQGLWIRGEYDNTGNGQDARARALSGSAPELSVGFVWLDDGGEDAENDITKARLVEGSQITRRFAAVPGAALTAVRGDEEDRAQRQRAQRIAAARLSLALAN